MNETLHLVRWGIPGTIFFAIVFFLSVVVRIGPAQPPSLFYFLNAHNYLEQQALIGTVAFLMGASVPVGFVIYQLYYCWFWFGWPKTRRNPARLLRQGGFQRLIDYYIQKYELKIVMDNEDQYIRSKFIPEKGLKTVHKLHYQWIILSRILRETNDKAVLIEMGRWDDIFHGLGSSCTAVILGSILFVSLWILPSPFDATPTEQVQTTNQSFVRSNIDKPSLDSITTNSDSSNGRSVSKQSKHDKLSESNMRAAIVNASMRLSSKQWLQIFITTLLVNVFFALAFRINRNAVIRNMSVTAKMILMELDKSGWPDEIKNEFLPEQREGGAAA